MYAHFSAKTFTSGECHDIEGQIEQGQGRWVMLA